MFIPESLKVTYVNLVAEKLATYKRKTSLDVKRSEAWAQAQMGDLIHKWLRENYSDFITWDYNRDRRCYEYSFVNHGNRGINAVARTMKELSNLITLKKQFGEGPFTLEQLDTMFATMDKAKRHILSRKDYDVVKQRMIAEEIENIDSCIDDCEFRFTKELAAELVKRHGKWDEYGISVKVVDYGVDHLITEDQRKTYSHVYGEVLKDGHYFFSGDLTCPYAELLIYSDEARVIAEAYERGWSSIEFNGHILSWERERPKPSPKNRTFNFAA